MLCLPLGTERVGGSNPSPPTNSSITWTSLPHGPHLANGLVCCADQLNPPSPEQSADATLQRPRLLVPENSKSTFADLGLVKPSPAY